MTDEQQLQIEQDKLIDEFGLYFDALGYQPIAGKITGLLIVSDKELLSFSEITSRLGISKGSASSMLHKLQAIGYINCKTSSSGRRHYYELNRTKLFSLVDDFERMCDNVIHLLNGAYNLKSDKQSTNAVFCNSLIDTIKSYKKHILSLKTEKY